MKEYIFLAKILHWTIGNFERENKYLWLKFCLPNYGLYFKYWVTIFLKCVQHGKIIDFCFILVKFK